MNRRLFAASVLPGAVGLAFALQAMPIQAAEMMKMPSGANKQVVMKNMQRMKTEHLQKCYGVNAVAKNDCAQGAHSCAGQATKARDPDSFVLLPAGDCSKIAGSSLKAG